MTASQPHPAIRSLSVRLSRYDEQRLDWIVTAARTNKTQIVRRAIQLALEAVSWSRRGRLVVRHVELGRQVGINVGPGAVESSGRSNMTSSLRLNLSDAFVRKLAQLQEAQFGDGQSATIRRALLLFHEILQYQKAGWTYGILDEQGRFYDLVLPGHDSDTETVINIEDEADYEAAKRRLETHVQRFLPDIVRKARHANENVEEVVDRFVEAGREQTFNLQVFDDCQTVEEFLTASARMVEEYERATSVIFAIAAVDDLSTHFRQLLVRYIQHHVKTYILHHDRNAVLALVPRLYQEADQKTSIEEHCYYVEVDAEFFKKKPQTVIFDLHSSTLRSGFAWFVSGDERQGRALSPDKIRAFFDQVGARIEKRARLVRRNGDLSEPETERFERAEVPAG